MKSLLEPASQTYLIDWGLTFAMGGAVFAVLGFVCGWIIWRKARKLTQNVEARNRAAFADYEKTSDEISRIKSELAVGGQ